MKGGGSEGGAGWMDVGGCAHAVTNESPFMNSRTQKGAIHDQLREIK